MNGMKLGDRLVCKMTCHLSGNTFTKNEIYIITKVFIDKKIVLNGTIFCTPEEIRKLKFNKYVYDYFYTKEEIRKKKLHTLWN